MTTPPPTAAVRTCVCVSYMEEESRPELEQLAHSPTTVGTDRGLRGSIIFFHLILLLCGFRKLRLMIV